MSNTVIKVENLAKKYKLGQVHTNLLSEKLGNYLRALVSHKTNGTNSTDIKGSSHINSAEFYALDNISFEIKQGEVVGIIGGNGAGKSTLLKILSRITEPTAGQAEILGRVGSLLEVGTGFHPELTGRENIFLNGAILGMSKAEIRKKFDEIVAFAEIEKFLDTPVKRYSSGMYVRLAFAVAAHLEPEILIVDEVLAVGDVQFQKKCLGKMGDVAKEGRTVLLVSHNMAAISRLCPKALLLVDGKIKCNGLTRDVIDAYNKEWSKMELAGIQLPPNQRRGDGRVRYSSVSIEGAAGSNIVRLGDPVGIRLHFKAVKPICEVRFYLWITDEMDEPMLFCSNHFSGEVINLAEGNGVVECLIAKNPLTPGRYWLNLDIYSAGVQSDYILRAIAFDVVFGDYYKSGVIPSDRGKVLVDYAWSMI